jgi:arylsulfatase A-like enzyme
VLVTLDTTRADAVGEADSITPFLDSLAARGLRFTRAFAATNSTQPSHASLLTGLAMQDHGVADNYSLVPPEVSTVAETLRESGYFTVAAVSQPCVGLGAGFGQGFDEFFEPGPKTHLDGRSTIAGVEQLLADLAGEPIFLWVHLYDPHTPYVPPRDFLERHLAERGLELPPRERDPATMPVLDVVPPDMEFLLGTTNLDRARFLYAAGVSYADLLTERLAEVLERAGRDDLAWIVTADHGESLGERNSWFNHRGLYPETTHVPLVVVLPQRVLSLTGHAAGETIRTPVSAVDVAPTLLELAGIATPRGSSRGESLLRVPADQDRRVWFEHANGHQVGTTDGRSYFVTTLTDEMTFGLEVEEDAEGRRTPVLPSVPRGTSVLFDVRSDPGLEHDLAPRSPERVAELLERLEEWRRTAAALRSREREMTQDEIDELGKLGYADQR